MGLRDEKKERTRRAILDTAWRLFADHGYDAVTVQQVAREAGVSPATVFNYVRGKEDLFFPRLDEFGDRLVATVAERPAGESVVAAVERALTATGGLVAQASAGDPVAAQRLRTLHRVVAASPALQARERQATDRYTAAQAAQLATALGGEGAAGDTSGADGEVAVLARAAAAALVGVQRTLVLHVRRRVLDDDRMADLDQDVRRLAHSALRMLEEGIGEACAGEVSEARRRLGA